MLACWEGLWKHDAGGLQDAGGWGVKLEALKLVVALVLNWRKATQQHLPSILDSAWTLFTGCSPLYIRGIVKGEEEISDGEASALIASCSARSIISHTRIRHAERKMILCQKSVTCIYVAAKRAERCQISQPYKCMGSLSSHSSALAHMCARCD